MQKLIIIFTTIFYLSVFSIQAQDTFQNMSKLGVWADNTVVPNSAVYFNEIWGYVDGTGNEYAVMGSPAEVHFIDVTNAIHPVLKQSFQGTYSSIWRDFKSYGNYVYGVHDGGSGVNEGLSIFNMTNLPGGSITKTTTDADFGRAHNIFIDEPNQRLYVAGSDTYSDGLIVYDLSNPAAPSLLKRVNLFNFGGYVHDLFVRDNIAYCNSGSGSNGGMWVYNLSDLDNIIPYAQEDTGGYNHSSWMTDDNNYVVYATETSNFPLYIVDVSDVANGNITGSTSFKKPNNAPTYTNNIAHNPLIKGNFCYVSYYEDGVQVWDISNPSTPKLTGFYDMVPNTSYNGTDRGVWGVYPFLPSGNILVSDDVNGLYVLKLNVNLPVELTEIKTRTVDNSQVIVDWTTATETNNKLFEVERSEDGINFDQIGTVNGNGNSTTAKSYSFTDSNPFSGTSYYRIKQVDYDSKFSYSEVVSARIRSKKSLLILFPNPVIFGNNVSINFRTQQDGLVQVGIYDNLGRTVFMQKFHSDNPIIQLDTEQLPVGIYSVKIESEGQIQSKKLVISQ